MDYPKEGDSDSMNWSEFVLAKVLLTVGIVLVLFAFILIIVCMSMSTWEQDTEKIQSEDIVVEWGLLGYKVRETVVGKTTMKSYADKVDLESTSQAKARVKFMWAGLITFIGSFVPLLLCIISVVAAVVAWIAFLNKRLVQIIAYISWIAIIVAGLTINVLGLVYYFMRVKLGSMRVPVTNGTASIDLGFPWFGWTWVLYNTIGIFLTLGGLIIIAIPLIIMLIFKYKNRDE